MQTNVWTLQGIQGIEPGTLLHQSQRPNHCVTLLLKLCHASIILLHIHSFIPKDAEMSHPFSKLISVFSSFRVDSQLFSSFNLEFYGRSLSYRLDQCTLYRLFDDKNPMYSSSYDIQCRIRCNFVIKQPVQNVSALIESINVIDRT